MKTKNDAIHMVKRWYSDIADLRVKQKMVVSMRDNVAEQKSGENMQFLDSEEIRSHFSTTKKQWQKGEAKPIING